MAYTWCHCDEHKLHCDEHKLHLGVERRRHTFVHVMIFCPITLNPCNSTPTQGNQVYVAAPSSNTNYKGRSQSWTGPWGSGRPIWMEKEYAGRIKVAIEVKHI